MCRKKHGMCGVWYPLQFRHPLGSWSGSPDKRGRLHVSWLETRPQTDAPALAPSGHHGLEGRVRSACPSPRCLWLGVGNSLHLQLAGGSHTCLSLGEELTLLLEHRPLRLVSLLRKALSAPAGNWASGSRQSRLYSFLMPAGFQMFILWLGSV